eukprot:10073417-Alexandrium_andersonii.AAC.1
MAHAVLSFASVAAAPREKDHSEAVRACTRSGSMFVLRAWQLVPTRAPKTSSHLVFQAFVSIRTPKSV